MQSEAEAFEAFAQEFLAEPPRGNTKLLNKADVVHIGGGEQQVYSWCKFIIDGTTTKLDEKGELTYCDLTMSVPADPKKIVDGGEVKIDLSCSSEASLRCELSFQSAKISWKDGITLPKVSGSGSYSTKRKSGDLSPAQCTPYVERAAELCKTLPEE